MRSFFAVLGKMNQVNRLESRVKWYAPFINSDRNPRHDSIMSPDLVALQGL